MTKFDFSKARIAPTALLKKADDAGRASATVPESKLAGLLARLEGLGVKLEPTNASTKRIIANSIAGAAIGGGVATLAAAAAEVAGYVVPSLWPFAIGGAAVGGAIGYFSTVYKIRITKTGDNGAGSPVFLVEILAT